MDKWKPTHDLGSFKAAMSTVETLAMTGTAQADALTLGFGRAEVVKALQSLERKHFYKSTTSVRNSRQWQDVYHLPLDGMTVYVKFTDDAVTQFTLLSFKEK